MRDEAADAIPLGLRRLWQPAELSRRGPSRRLSLPRIVAEAIRIADREGLGALSMARLADRLGCAPMALYRHVADKEELLVRMMDAAPGKPPPIDGTTRAWRSGLERWARALRGVYARHPWVLEITAGRPPLDPGQLAWLECGLRTLEGTGLSPRERFRALFSVVTYVRGQAQTLPPLESGGAEARGGYGRLLAALLVPERFPSLARLVAAGVFDEQDPRWESKSFELGLRYLLDGVEARVGRGAAPRRRRSTLGHRGGSERPTGSR